MFKSISVILVVSLILSSFLIGCATKFVMTEKSNRNSIVEHLKIGDYIKIHLRDGSNIKGILTVIYLRDGGKIKSILTTTLPEGAEVYAIEISTRGFWGKKDRSMLLFENIVRIDVKSSFVHNWVNTWVTTPIRYVLIGLGYLATGLLSSEMGK